MPLQQTVSVTYNDAIVIKCMLALAVANCSEEMFDTFVKTRGMFLLAMAVGDSDDE